MSDDVDHLSTFLAAGKRFEHEGSTWEIVEVQHGGTMTCRHVMPANPTLVVDALTRSFPFDVLAGQRPKSQVTTPEASTTRTRNAEAPIEMPSETLTIVYGDAFGVESPRARAARTKQMVAAALGPKKS